MRRSRRACKAARRACWRPAAPSVRPNCRTFPTIAEAGVPNFDVTSWNALYAPAGTPQAVIDKLNGALHDVLADPELKKRALDLGIDAEASTPAEIDARMKSDIAKWTKVIESAHIPRQ